MWLDIRSNPPAAQEATATQYTQPVYKLVRLDYKRADLELSTFKSTTDLKWRTTVFAEKTTSGKGSIKKYNLGLPTISYYRTTIGICVFPTLREVDIPEIFEYIIQCRIPSGTRYRIYNDQLWTAERIIPLKVIDTMEWKLEVDKR